MPRTLRQIIGAAALVIFVPLYALLVMRLAGDVLEGASILIQTAFFAVGGLVWVVPAGAIIYWMQRRR